MSLPDAVAASFLSALAQDFYPTRDVERLFGIRTEQGQTMLGAWRTLYKLDGSINATTISKALRTDKLPEAFREWVQQSAGSSYTYKVVTAGFDSIPWMRMVEFKYSVNDNE
jgi:hypothetical protein